MKGDFLVNEKWFTHRERESGNINEERNEFRRDRNV